MISDRFINPLLGLAHGWEIKIPLAALMGLLASFAEHVFGLYGEMLAVDAGLVLLIVSLFVIDLLTGIAGARRRKEEVSSQGFRRGMYKALEYSAFAFVGISLANGFADQPFHYLTDGLDDATLLYIALTEGFSIVENLTGSNAGAWRVVRRIHKIAKGAGGSIMVEEEIRSKRKGAEAPKDSDKNVSD